MENQKHPKIPKRYLDQENPRILIIIILYLFQIKLYALHLWMIVYYRIAPRKIMRRFLINLNMTDLNIIGSLKRDKVFHNL